MIEPPKRPLHALRMPAATLVGNEAYMAITSLEWTLNAGFALPLP